jgi:hypothetical protein
VTSTPLSFSFFSFRYWASARSVKTDRSVYNSGEWVRLDFFASAQQLCDKALVAFFFQQTRLPVSLYLLPFSSLIKRKTNI